VPSLRFVYGRLGDLQITANLRHWCKSISVLPVAERTIFGFACERTKAHEYMRAHTAMQYEFVLHCCDVHHIVYCIADYQ